VLISGNPQQDVFFATIPAVTAAATHDINGDGKSDILWKDTSGNVAIWLMNGLTIWSSGILGHVGTTWSVAGTADFDGDGMWDILWRDTSGNTAIWLNSGARGTLGVVPTNWIIAETGDYNGDGKSDILWRDTSTGTVAIWFMNGLQVSSSSSLGVVPTSWTIQGLNAD
jgi:hypothetical protein